jgi:hypothetical protein
MLIRGPLDRASLIGNAGSLRGEAPDPSLCVHTTLRIARSRKALPL